MRAGMLFFPAGKRQPNVCGSESQEKQMFSVIGKTNAMTIFFDFPSRVHIQS